MPPSRKTDVAVVVAGQAGQGIQTIESILTRVLKRSGYHVFATKEYMSRIRGGNNSTLIRIGSEQVLANVDRIDYLVPLDEGALAHLADRITPDTLVIGEKEKLKTSCECIDVSFTAIAEEVGGKLYANTVAIAALCGILEGELEILEDFLRKNFSRKGEDVVAKNIEAARKGFEVGAGIMSSGDVPFVVKKHPEVPGHLIVSGAEGVTLGAISGGCRFISSYPMSPGTAVLRRMSQLDDRFGVVVEQAEDEIAAINMAIGAWYAGARAMVTTSGGGFALMEEGVSLAGITESPMVIHIAQRPGPATGMATRTEQADLDLAVYSGHGEFPRIVYTPGGTEEAFELTHRAFEMADQFQVPVFILTDQYLIDSYYSVPHLPVEKMVVEDRTIKTTKRYMRYAFTDNGISPRGLPGFGKGLVAVDSHEHTEDGHITEDIGIRNRMMEKRMGKFMLIEKESVPPTLIGSEDFKILVVGWGSTKHMLAEATELLRRDDIAVLHFPQVYPVPPGTQELLEKAETSILVENNYSGQLGKLLRTHCGFTFSHEILQYDGRPFCSDLLARKILKAAGRRASGPKTSSPKRSRRKK
jgi:2-oxoglutarate ferredoxin oxidoreductase subunit alpha